MCAVVHKEDTLELPYSQLWDSAHQVSMYKTVLYQLSRYKCKAAQLTLSSLSLCSLLARAKGSLTVPDDDGHTILVSAHRPEFWPEAPE